MRYFFIFSFLNVRTVVHDKVMNEWCHRWQQVSFCQYLTVCVQRWHRCTVVQNGILMEICWVPKPAPPQTLKQLQTFFCAIKKKQTKKKPSSFLLTFISGIKIIIVCYDLWNGVCTQALVGLLHIIIIIITLLFFCEVGTRYLCYYYYL